MTRLFELSDITLEGPDLAGKTTLYNKLHKETNFKWNIQDRAEISMAIYSEMYGRDDSNKWWQKVYKKLLNLNHRYIILLPSKDLMLERYKSRGDDIQDEISLVYLHNKFVEAASKLSKFDTCIIVNITKKNQSNIKQDIIEGLNVIESSNTFEICAQIEGIAASCNNNEAHGLSLEMNLTNFNDYNYSALEYEKEREYYDRITHDYTKIIESELMGDNEYGIPQDPMTTRRFVYTNNACISYINTQVRNNCMTMSVVCRSSDVQNTFFYDLCFMKILSKKIKEILIKTCDITHVIMNVRLDSAHTLDNSR
jgi:deoxyadenosine/deoxycytidine kinase